ncbi:MAG: hypothetical protein B7Z75_08900 [Acidocella sp. 20-57-95]|nr:MAG: hypothetical protein B7Z75_08900 [Acidocella sp. 20-57-95]OYV57810.1 MAG: hypothetical protein B7Z71_12035 [Acidocella sp. 21-58-7]HQT64225.1 YdcF family protein [Acidocella sp.]HQU05487.1 YdcF family protein [Acidocella sp.]
MARRRHYRRRHGSAWGWVARWAGRALLVLAGLWLVGLLAFTVWVWRAAPPEKLPHTDGIVALTGGDDRVSAALGLLADKAAPLLLISGAGRGTYLGDFTADDTAAATHYASAITLGHKAASTRGNAVEVAAWVQRFNLHSLLIVTADYHMPRAMRVLAESLPHVVLVAYPVRPPAMHHMFAFSTWRLLAGEYSKYLVVRSGLDVWLGVGLGSGIK